MDSQQLGDTDSWLDSLPPWSSGLCAPFRPWTCAQSIASSTDNARIPSTVTTLGLLRRFLQTKTALELEDLGLIVDPDAGIKIGEGTTYIVEKRSILRYKRSRHISGDWVAVKRAKCVVPKLHGDGIALPSASLKCLTAVLLEIEILLHPPLRRHPNITHLIGFSWDMKGRGSIPLLVTEFASFGTLTELFRAHPVGDLEKQQLCLDVAQGLEVLHSSMVVHGDIKQDNILAFPHPQRRFIAKISDFGHSLLGSDQPIYRGTAIYNAPEVHLQDSSAANKWVRMPSMIPPDQFPKCDIFSYGLLVFEILNGGQRYYSFPESIPFQKMLMGEARGSYYLVFISIII